MKKLLLSLLIIHCSLLFAQAPQSFKYQAVARDNSGNPVKNGSVNFRISILLNSPSGTVSYSETFATSTNAFGLATLEIGHGTPVSGIFTGINWSTGTYFIKVEVATSGVQYVFMGTSQLLSVPYALYAEKSGTAGPTGATGAKGDPGAKGATGDVGPTGIGGANGATGAKGDTGAQGPAGTGLTNKGNWTASTAYSVGDYVFDRSTGSASQNSMWICRVVVNSSIQPYQDTQHWIEFQAPQGEKGATGAQGIQGIQGVQGISGQDGAKGDKGVTGATGATGAQGQQGAAGTGLTNKGNWVTSTAYSVGDYVFDRSTGSASQNSMWICKLSVNSQTHPYLDNSHWVEFQAPQGSTGATGPQGQQGIAGVKGETGPYGMSGPQGIQGDKGATGAQGIQGIQGIAGAKGDAGAQGIQGIQGVAGAKGEKGNDGAKGDKGDAGPMGLQGDAGATGEKGDKGDKGDAGIQGIQGPKGDNGTDGIDGATGPTGPAGTSEISGTSNFIPKFTSATALGNSLIFDDGAHIGIGTNTPLYEFQLHNSNAARIYLDGQSSNMIMRRIGITNHSYLGFENDNILQWTIGVFGNDNFSIRNNQTEFNSKAFTITRGANNVGLGTLDPIQKLHVEGNIYNTGSLGYMMKDQTGPMITKTYDNFTSGSNNGAGRWGMFIEPSTLVCGIPALSDRNFEVATYNENSTINSVLMHVGSNGFVGIGTAIPEAGLDVRLESDLYKPQLMLYENSMGYARFTLRNQSNAATWTIAAINGDIPADERFNIYHSTTGDLMSIKGNGVVNFKGKVTRDSVGSANLLPIAYGKIYTDAGPVINIISGTGNFTCEYIPARYQYLIHINNYYVTYKDITLVTIQKQFNATAAVSSYASYDDFGNLIITLYDKDNLMTTGYFSFIIYKP